MNKEVKKINLDTKVEVTLRELMDISIRNWREVRLKREDEIYRNKKNHGKSKFDTKWWSGVYDGIGQVDSNMEFFINLMMNRVIGDKIKVKGNSHINNEDTGQIDFIYQTMEGKQYDKELWSDLWEKNHELQEEHNDEFQDGTRTKCESNLGRDRRIEDRRIEIIKSQIN